jgi:aspartyl-tRNA(Asn)/glutamyl-tRNA(Gln) amidotransferase subunit A
MYLNDIYTISANLAGLCGLSVPSGFDDAGLPIGTQLMCRAFDEQNLFDIATALESQLSISKQALDITYVS